MLYLIFSDVHGNLEAYKRMLKAAERINPDAFVCLGDIVGYGPNPNETIDRTKKLKNLFIIRGNHDKVAAGLDSTESFNPVARKAIIWTKKKLKDKNKEYLKKLPKGPLLIDNKFTIFHGSYFDEDYYIFNPFDAILSLQNAPTRISFFGHTHIPIVFKFTPSDKLEIITITTMKNKLEIKLNSKSYYLINPGSIGQPRDRNQKISFITYDTKKKTITFYRYKYPFQNTALKILKQKLPRFLAERLGKGI